MKIVKCACNNISIDEDWIWHVVNYKFDAWQVQNEVIKPTINGVLDIMKACLKAKTVRRLIFTSSAGTLNANEPQKPVFDETCWSDVEFCRRVKMTGWVSNLSPHLWIMINVNRRLSYHLTRIKDKTTISLSFRSMKKIFVFSFYKTKKKEVIYWQKNTIYFSFKIKYFS